jgi:ABC-type multidrug transport system fused ATPase/permease subunit
MGQSCTEPYRRWSCGHTCGLGRHSYREDKCWIRWRGTSHNHELQHELDESHQILDDAGNFYECYCKDQLLRQRHKSRKRTYYTSRIRFLLAWTRSYRGLGPHRLIWVRYGPRYRRSRAHVNNGNSEHLTPTLRNVSLLVKPGEKIAICGSSGRYALREFSSTSHTSDAAR